MYLCKSEREKHRERIFFMFWGQVNGDLTYPNLPFGAFRMWHEKGAGSGYRHVRVCCRGRSSRMYVCTYDRASPQTGFLVGRGLYVLPNGRKGGWGGGVA